ncbi:MAG: hypothetical protein JWR80_2754 [Bradyrhizobium sp.]|nr:hypothetical protein [Bradyrhizobium sp.]
MSAADPYTRIGPYEIVIDSTRRHIKITVTGFVTMADFDAFEGSLSQIMTRLGWSAGSYTGLIDNRRHDVAQQELVGRIQQFLKSPILQPVRLAVLSGSMLSKLQSKRLDPQNQVFTTEAEAIAWLFPK